MNPFYAHGAALALGRLKLATVPREVKDYRRAQQMLSSGQYDTHGSKNLPEILRTGYVEPSPIKAAWGPGVYLRRGRPESNYANQLTPGKPDTRGLLAVPHLPEATPLPEKNWLIHESPLEIPEKSYAFYPPNAKQHYGSGKDSLFAQHKLRHMPYGTLNRAGAALGYTTETSSTSSNATHPTNDLSYFKHTPDDAHTQQRAQEYVERLQGINDVSAYTKQVGDRLKTWKDRFNLTRGLGALGTAALGTAAVAYAASPASSKTPTLSLGSGASPGVFGLLGP